MEMLDLEGRLDVALAEADGVPQCDGCGREVRALGELCSRCEGTYAPDDTEEAQ
jgi:predicted amidophosphoribosyltransferase